MVICRSVAAVCGLPHTSVPAEREPIGAGPRLRHNLREKIRQHRSNMRRSRLRIDGDTAMRHVWFGVTLAVAIVTAVSPLRAQAPLPPTAVAWPWPQAASAAAYRRHPFTAPTPDAAYL